MKKRVVVSGLGVVSSLGIGKKDFWNALISGKSGISEISSFDTSSFATHFGGEIKNFNPASSINKHKIKLLGQTSLLALTATKLAIEDSRLELKNLDPNRIGVCIGTTMGESQILQELNYNFVKKGFDSLDPKLMPYYPANVLADNIAIEFGISGANYVFPTACAAGNYAIGYAYDLIQMGEAEIMLAVGADAFSKIAFIGFNQLFAVAPEKCQPFDKNRKGMMVGEGSGVLVLETLDNALKRKAPIYAEVLGYGLSCDAHHMTSPFSEGIKDALENALKQSGIKPEEVNYINAHGTGTLANDKEECLAIKKVFKEYKKLAVSSTKSMLGHTMGAASAMEAIVCCLSVKEDLIPPTINYETPDPDCDIDCVPNTARKQKVNIALNNSAAFGGNNACLVLSKFSGN